MTRSLTVVELSRICGVRASGAAVTIEACAGPAAPAVPGDTARVVPIAGPADRRSAENDGACFVTPRDGRPRFHAYGALLTRRSITESGDRHHEIPGSSLVRVVRGRRICRHGRPRWYSLPSGSTAAARPGPARVPDIRRAPTGNSRGSRSPCRAEHSASAMRLGDYVGLLRRQWLPVLLCLVLGVGAALAYVQLGAPGVPVPDLGPGDADDAGTTHGPPCRDQPRHRGAAGHVHRDRGRRGRTPGRRRRPRWPTWPTG